MVRTNGPQISENYLYCINYEEGALKGPQVIGPEITVKQSKVKLSKVRLSKIKLNCRRNQEIDCAKPEELIELFRYLL